MPMVKDMVSMPERAEPLAPPSLSGVLQPSKFHLLRRRQLQDLARAYAIAVPDGATKEQLVRFMTQAEENGAFRSKPKSKYHLLHAELDHDLYLQGATAQEQERIRMALPELEADERPVYTPPPPPDGRTLDQLQAQARELGINVMAKNAAALRREIALAEKGDAEVPDR